MQFLQYRHFITSQIVPQFTIFTTRKFHNSPRKSSISYPQCYNDNKKL